ncbi:trp operon leader peptide [Streptomyces fructofermentans]
MIIGEARRGDPETGRIWDRVRRMFAHSISTWWWTAHPAAH